MGMVAYLRLSLTPGIGPVLARRMIDLAGSADAAVALSRSQLQQVEGIGSSKAASIERALGDSARIAEYELKKVADLGARVICPEDDLWPALLRPLPDAPLALYVQGTLEPRDLQSLAIVGSRRCSHYGREQAERFASLLAGAGFTVISGGARGIDSSAHRGALAHLHGRTIAVVGSGLDVIYPPENAELFKQIAQRGAVITEFPTGTPPVAENFPRRNRIVSGMSRGVLVIEAAERSGALITARVANEDHGRPVFALPGRVDNELAAGPHLLIRDGATLTRNLEDILDALDPLPDDVTSGSGGAALFEFVQAGMPAATTAAETGPLAAHIPPAADAHAEAHAELLKLPPGLTATQERVLLELGDDPLAVDQLIDRTGLPAGSVLQDLTLLTLKGLVKRVDGQTYLRRR